MASLDGGDLGWLKAKHHFMISPTGNRAHRALGSLVVWNDDEIASGQGFRAHRHENVDIITCVRQGAVAHQDSLGNTGRIEAGDVQVMSAGTGISHDEHNATDTWLKIFQIWIKPREPGGAPYWNSRPFPKEERSGYFVILASGDPSDTGALPLRADARLLGATLKAGDTLTHALPPDRNAYLVLARGSALTTTTELRLGTVSHPLGAKY